MPHPTADFTILTALEEERDAVLRMLVSVREIDRGRGEVYTHHAAELDVLRTGRPPCRVVVSCFAAMGPVEAALRAAEAARRFRSCGVLLVGIAGGVRGRVGLGDVLVANQIVDSTLGKIEPNRRSVRWQVYPADALLLDAASNCAADWDTSIQAPRPTPGSPQRHIGAIATTSDVIASAARIAEIQADWPKLVGVEMEGSGVAAALHADARRPRFLMVRGVSDFADEQKCGQETLGFREYACQAAAAYAIALIARQPIPFESDESNVRGAGEDVDTQSRGRLLARVRRGLSLSELEVFVAEAFPWIPGGLSGIVAPVHDLRYQTHQVVEFFARRRKLVELATKLDEALGPDDDA
jgi:nucleoside phosphorylase